MTRSPSPILAIDGGGTACRLACADSERVVTVESGSANVSTDFDGAVVQIRAGLGRLAQKTGHPLERLARFPAFAGVAGVTGREIAERLRAALPLGNVRIADDRLAALRGALGDRDGVVAHCGTGSFFAARIDGGTRLAGGWGPVLGDEASAHWVGRNALSETLRAVDAGATDGVLSRHVLTAFGSPAGIVAFAGGAHQSDMAALAPVVTRLAEEGDPMAQGILDAGAAHIASGALRLGWRPDLPFCLTGGIGPEYAPFLSENLRAALVVPDGTPLDGALSLAREVAEAGA